MSTRIVLLSAVFVGALLACDGGVTTTTSSTTGTSASSGASGGGGHAALPVPAVHRAATTPCTGDRPPGSAEVPAPPGSECAADADCTKGANGRCFASLGGPNTCSYDECAKDADCGGASVCDCHNAAHYGANACFHGDCVVDADCGPGGYCSPSAVQLDSSCSYGIEPGSFGYFCHVAGDECTDDADCAPDGSRLCIFQVEAMHWACKDILCTG